MVGDGRHRAGVWLVMADRAGVWCEGKLKQ